jgi:membrane protease YdiL (CAAX protease family)
VSSWLGGRTPPAYALPLAGFGALGPLLAAFVLARRRGELRGVFGVWRTRPIWIAIGLLLPGFVHTVANCLDVALGRQPSQWFYPPTQVAQVLALVFIPLLEEFGWRGFAYPRAAARHGPVLGALLVGTVWGLWHFAWMFTPEDGAPSPAVMARAVAGFALASVVWAWLFEKSGRSMFVALALHAGAHLDNATRIPSHDDRIVDLMLGVRLVLATLAAIALTRSARSRAVSRGGAVHTNRGSSS